MDLRGKIDSLPQNTEYLSVELDSVVFPNNKITGIKRVKNHLTITDDIPGQRLDLGSLEYVGTNADFRRADIASLGNLKEV